MASQTKKELVSSAVHEVSDDFDTIADGNAEEMYEEYDVEAEMESAFENETHFGHEREKDVPTGNETGQPEKKKKRKEKGKKPKEKPKGKPKEKNKKEFSGLPALLKTILAIIGSVLVILAVLYGMMLFTGINPDSLLPKEEPAPDTGYVIPNDYIPAENSPDGTLIIE